MILRGLLRNYRINRVIVGSATSVIKKHIKQSELRLDSGTLEAVDRRRPRLDLRRVSTRLRVRMWVKHRNLTFYLTTPLLPDMARTLHELHVKGPSINVRFFHPWKSISLATCLTAIVLGFIVETFFLFQIVRLRRSLLRDF